MSGKPVYIKDECRLYRCDPGETANDDGSVDHSCRQYICETSEATGKSDCTFMGQNEVSERSDGERFPYAVRKNADGSFTVHDTVFKNEVGTIDKIPQSGAIRIDGDNLAGIRQFDLEGYLKNWGSCDPMENGPASTKITDGPSVEVRNLPSAIVSIDGKPVTLFTVRGDKKANLPKTAAKLNSWIRTRADKSDIIGQSGAVVIFHPKNMNDRATDLAAEYISKGIYAVTVTVPDRIYSLQLSDDDVSSRLNGNLSKTRATSLTVAYLPTENVKIYGKEIPPLDSEDPNERTRQNNRLAARIIGATIGESNLSKLYHMYLYTFRLTPEAMDVVEVEG